MGEMRTRKCIHLKLPCVGGSNLPSVRPFFVKACLYKKVTTVNVELSFRAFSSSKSLPRPTPLARSTVSQQVPCFY